MMRFLLLAVVVLAAAVEALSGPQAAALVTSRRLTAEKAVGPPPRYFTQDQDHFDGTNANTWQQAYYVNDTFWKPGSDAPVFICVGGEGPPLDGSAVVSSVHCNGAVEMLPSTGAIMFAVEHRYYGCHNMSACPVPSFKDGTAALRFLSSRQALADLAQFHAFASATYGLDATRNKWVSFGGSYPGMLAGWFRLRFPHLVHASVASSAPVQAVLDMDGYNDVVAAAYAVSDNGVGGSVACEAAIRKGHADIGNMFASASGRATLAQLFGGLPAQYAVRDFQATFAGNGVAYFPAQENDPSCTEPACDIGSICVVMTNATLGDEVQRLAALRKTQLPWLGDVLTAASLRHPTPNAEVDYWGYQTCTEFGFYQTCNVGSQCFFTQGYVLLNSSMAFCTSEFGISAAKVAANIDYTNAYYGGWRPAGSCLLYPNGEVDPWASQSITTAPSAGIQTLFVPGASHHFWTHPTLATDQPSVVSARSAIRKYVEGILQSDCLQAQA